MCFNFQTSKKSQVQFLKRQSQQIGDLVCAPLTILEYNSFRWFTKTYFNEGSISKGVGRVSLSAQTATTKFHRLCVRVFYLCIINYHKLSNLKRHKFITSQFPQIRNTAGHILKSRCCLGFLIWRMQGESLYHTHSHCWQNLVPSDCRTVVYFSLLVIIHIPCHVIPFIFKASTLHQILLMPQISDFFTLNSRSSCK